jgi:MerR family transcriptional regulator, copper efflux regulator
MAMVRSDAANRSAPLACSLAPGDLAGRIDRIAALGRRSLEVAQRTDEGGAILTFKSDAGTRGELAEIVAAETRCCPFLELTVREGERAVVLEVAGPTDAAPVVDELVEAFAGTVGGAS